MSPKLSTVAEQHGQILLVGRTSCRHQFKIHLGIQRCETSQRQVRYPYSQVTGQSSPTAKMLAWEDTMRIRQYLEQEAMKLSAEDRCQRVMSDKLYKPHDGSGFIFDGTECSSCFVHQDQQAQHAVREHQRLAEMPAV